MRALVSPVTIGREAEGRVLAEALDAARCGGGGVVLLVGEGGAGKTRLVAEVQAEAVEHEMAVLTGRAARVGPASPLRPLTEALAGALRDPARRRDDLAPLAAALGGLLPDWPAAQPAGAPQPVVAVAEAVLGLLRALAGDGGLVLVLEDLQWADGDTVTVVEYLAHHLAQELVLCVGTARPDPPGDAVALAERLSETRAGLVIPVARLGDDDVDALARACLDTATLPGRLTEALRSRAGGLPLVVEEMLMAALRSGVLVRRDDEWVLEGDIPLVLPPSVRAAAAERLGRLDDDTRLLVHAVAVVGAGAGRLLARVTGLDDERVRRGLRAAVDAGLLVPGPDGAPAFAQALTRQAVLAQLLAVERDDLARRALVEIDAAGPGAAAAWAEQAAQLSEWVGEEGAAGRHLLAAGRAALAAGALGRAEALLERARALAGDPSVAVEVDEALTATLGAAGKPERAMTVGTGALARLADRGEPPAPAAAVHLNLARAGLAGRRGDVVETHLAHARRLARGAGDAALLADVDVVAGWAALRHGDPDAARGLAACALAAVTPAEAPAVVCEALLVDGRALRERDPAASAEALGRAARLAAQHGLELAALDARWQLAHLHAWQTGEVEALRAARDRAEQLGAVATEATIGLHLAWAHLDRFEVEAATDVLDRVLSHARRFGLAVLPVALATLGRCHLLAGDDEAMERLVAQALTLADNDPTTSTLVWAGCRAVSSLADEERGRARRELTVARDVAAGHLPPAPWAFLGLGALVRAVDGDAPPAPSIGGHARWVRGHLAMADAVALGREGRGSDASVRMAEADADLATAPWHHQYARRLVAEAAIDDGWGDPVVWLREALAFFEANGHAPVVAACKRLLQDAGAAVPRRGRGSAEVPPALRSLGVTSREMDVLQLVVAGLSNADIAARLYLSPRTVKTHVASLLQRTGTTNRRQLGAFGAEHGCDGGGRASPGEASEVRGGTVWPPVRTAVRHGG